MLANDETNGEREERSHDDVEDSQSPTLTEDVLDGGSECQP